MTNLTRYPLVDAFETTLAQSYDGGTGDCFLNEVPEITFPVGVKTYMVVNPRKSNMQVVEIDDIDTLSNSVNVSDSTIYKSPGVLYDEQDHSVGSIVIISNNFQFWQDIYDSINSKLDSNGGNATTTFSLAVTGSNRRIRKSGNDMYFRDDNQAEISLSALAALSGVNDKVKISSNDTTTNYLLSKLTGGDGISVTEINDGSNETIDLYIDLADTTIFTSTAVASKVPKTNGSGYLIAFINSNADGSADTGQKGLAERLTDAEAIAFADTTRYGTAYQDLLQQDVTVRNKLLYNFVDDFENVPGTAQSGLVSYVSGTGAAVGPTNNSNDITAIGFLNIATGTTTTGYAGVMTDATALLMGGGVWSYETRIDIEDLSNGSHRYQLLCGFYGDGTQADQVSGVYFLYDEGGVSTGSAASANRQIVTAQASTRTFTTTSTAVATDQWITLKIVVNAAGTLATFYINGVSVGTSSTNIPVSSTSEVGYGTFIKKSVGTTSREYNCDYVAASCLFTSSR